MTHRLPFLPLLLLSLAAQAAPVPGTIESVRFAARELPPVYELPAAYRSYETWFRAGLKLLPEGSLVLSVLRLGSVTLGLDAGQLAKLTPFVADAYAQIGSDPAFAPLPSALPEAFASRPMATGHYFLCRPAMLGADPLAIVFLHGSGGNFQLYTWLLRQEFPAALILLPSWGAGWQQGPASYVQDMLADVQRRTGLRLRRLYLIGLSAGGVGGFAVYQQLATIFGGYVSIAGAAPLAVARRLSPSLRILMLNGTADTMIPLAEAQRGAAVIKGRVAHFRLQEIAGDHFFLLSNRQTTFAAIRAFISDSAAPPPPADAR